MTLNKLVKNYFNLLVQLTKRIIALRPFDFVYVVTLFTINQLSFMLATFLPIKILIMMGTDGVPRYLRFFISPEEKERWILILVGLSAGFYILYSLTEYLVEQRGRSVARKVMRRADKIELFENQDKFISETFLKIAKSWSGYAMVVGGFLIGYWIDWRVFLAISFALIAEYLVVYALWGRGNDIGHIERRANLASKRATIVNLCSGFNFLVAFSILFYLFFIGQIENFIVAIVMILIARQVMTRLRVGVTAGFYLFSNEEKIKALFYDNEQYKQTVDQVERHFIESLLPESRHKIINVGEQVTSMALSSYSWFWIDTGQKNIACLVTGAEDNCQLLLKVYANNQKLAFQNERYLSQELQGKLELMPELIASGDVGGLAAALYKVPEFDNAQDSRDLIGSVKSRLFEFQLDEYLVDRFSRATPNIAERLTVNEIDQLRISKESDADVINELKHVLPRVLEAVQKQPRKLVNQDLTPLTVRQHRQNGAPLVLFWHRVSVQPAACLYSLIEYSKLETKTVVGELTLKLEQLERLIKQQKFNEGYDLVASVLALSKQLDESGGGGND